MSDDDSDAEKASYPSSLLEGANDAEGDSPRKIARNLVRAPMKRRQTTKEAKKRQRSEGEKGADELPILGPDHGDDVFGAGDSGNTGPFDEDHTWPTPLNPVGSAVVFSEEDVSIYGEAVEDFTSMFTCIEDRLFVVEGWDTQRRKCTVRFCPCTQYSDLSLTWLQLGWYHLQYLWIDNDLHTACTCPQGISDLHCIHQAFFKSFEAESLLRVTLPANDAKGLLLFTKCNGAH